MNYRLRELAWLQKASGDADLNVGQPNATPLSEKPPWSDATRSGTVQDVAWSRPGYPLQPDRRERGTD
jgi:hypothetical protein